MSSAVLEISAKLNAALKERPVPEVGIHPNTSHAEYLRWAGASNSRLSKLKRSPAHLKAYLDEPDQDSDALRIGRAVHSAILEPDSFTGVYVVAGQCTGVKKDKARCVNNGKSLTNEGWRCDVHPGALKDLSKAVISASDYAICLKARDAVHAHASAHRLLIGEGQNELSLAWVDTESGVLCKARHDRHSPVIAGGAVVDVKTTGDASPRAFERSIYKYSYEVQGAHYLSGATELHLPADHFVIVAVEKEPPFGVAVYRLNEAALDAGEEQRRRLLSLYAECERTGLYPCYADEVRDAFLPDFAWRQIEEENSQ